MYGLNPGTKIEHYVLESQLGEGGQGSVWRAHLDTAPDRGVALKIIPVRGTPASMVERVRREAEALVRLSQHHPSVVSCDGLVEDEQHGVLGVVMELVVGADMSDAVRDPRCDVRAREQILMHVARALGYLHAEGFVHRDVKPQNILVASRFYETPSDPSTVKLVDFGIVTPKGNPKPLTEVGTVIGTPAYMPPERIDPMFWRAPPGSMPTEDVFALGVVAYEAFFGRHPAGVEDDGTLSIYAEKYREVSRGFAPWPELPPAHLWTSALRGALALKRDDRLQDGNAVANAVAPQGAQQSAPPAGGTQMQMPVFAEQPQAFLGTGAAAGGGSPRTQVNAEMSAPVDAATPYGGTRAPSSPEWTAPPAGTTQIPQGGGASPYGGPANPMAMAPAYGGQGGPAVQGQGQQDWAAAAHPPAKSGGGSNTGIRILLAIAVLFTAAIPIAYFATRGSSGDSAPPPTPVTATPTDTAPEGTVAPDDSEAPPAVSYPPGVIAPPVLTHVIVPPHSTATGTSTVHVPPTATTTVAPPATTVRPPATVTTPPPVVTVPPANTTGPGPIHIGPPTARPPVTAPPTVLPPFVPPVVLPPGGKGPIVIHH